MYACSLHSVSCLVNRQPMNVCTYVCICVHRSMYVATLHGIVFYSKKNENCSEFKRPLTLGTSVSHSSRLRIIGILFLEKYVRIFTYSILSYAYPRTLLYTLKFVKFLIKLHKTCCFILKLCRHWAALYYIKRLWVPQNKVFPQKTCVTLKSGYAFDSAFMSLLVSAAVCVPWVHSCDEMLPLSSTVVSRNVSATRFRFLSDALLRDVRPWVHVLQRLGRQLWNNCSNPQVRAHLRVGSKRQRTARSVPWMPDYAVHSTST